MSKRPFDKAIADIAVGFGVDFEELPKAAGGRASGPGGPQAPYKLPASIIGETLSALENGAAYADYNDYLALMKSALGAALPEEYDEVWGYCRDFTEKGKFELDAVDRFHAENDAHNDGNDFFRHVASGNAALATKMRREAAWAAFPPIGKRELKAIADAALPDWLIEMNANHAIVEPINGVIRFTPDGNEPFLIMSFGHFREVNNGKRKIPTGSKGRPIGVGTAWLGHAGARRYESMGLWLIGEEPPKALNLYQGFPKKSGLDP